MKKYSTTPTCDWVVGIDLGGKKSRFCELATRSGDVLLEGEFRTTPEHLTHQFGDDRKRRIVIETGTHSPWVSRHLVGLGHEVIVANPHQVQLIYKAKNKSDRVDAEKLARLGRTDAKLLSPIEHRSREAQADLAIIRSRDALVESRTKLINHCRGVSKSFGAPLKASSAAAFAKKTADQIAEELHPSLNPVIAVLKQIECEIKEMDKKIATLGEEKYPQTELLQEISGVGPITSLAYVLTLDDPRRFADSRSVGAFLGLTGRMDQSGDHSPELRITKAGDGYMRKLLVGSAQYLLRDQSPDTDLKRWGLKLASRGGKNAKKRAVVAVARKLAVLLHRLWLNGELYEPLRQAKIKQRVA